MSIKLDQRASPPPVTDGWSGEWCDGFNPIQVPELCLTITKEHGMLDLFNCLRSVCLGVYISALQEFKLEV